MAGGFVLVLLNSVLVNPSFRLVARFFFFLPSPSARVSVPTFLAISNPIIRPLFIAFSWDRLKLDSSVLQINRSFDTFKLLSSFYRPHLSLRPLCTPVNNFFVPSLCRLQVGYFVKLVFFPFLSQAGYDSPMSIIVWEVPLFGPH